MRAQRMLCGVALCWAVALLQFASGDEATPKTSIVFISPEQTKDVNDTATLNCTVDNPDRYKVMWMRKDRDRSTEGIVLSMGDSMALRDDRIRLNISDDGRVYLLNIHDIQPQDSAIYECQLLVSTTNKITKHVDLLVRTPAQVDLSGAAPQRAALVNETVTLTCKAHGFPRPTMHWLRENDALLPAGGNKYLGSALTLVAVQPQDRGTYYCVAENGVGQPDRRGLDFEVQFAPQVRTPRPRVAQAVGYDIELECVFEAFPRPTVEWFRRDAKATDASADIALRPETAHELGYEIHTSGAIDDVTTSVLRVLSVQRQHFGNYACRATNAAGQAYALVNLYKSILAVNPWMVNAGH